MQGILQIHERHGLSLADVAVVGGGAAGLATAIFAARRNPNRLVILLDGAKKLGAKILISGGGRCNVTHAVVEPEDFNATSRPILRRILSAFSVSQTREFFESMDVRLKVEPGGKLFPVTDRARTILDALYDLVARTRYRLFGRTDSACPVLPAHLRSRFDL
jgi:predicted flavoprotein YhiN